MRIAQVSPLFESVPPKTYGGTERVVSYLTEELVRQGHDVTLFASGDSVTQAKLVSAVPTSIRSSGQLDSWLVHHTVQLDQVREMVEAFDVVHFHTGYLHFPLARQLAQPNLTTMHDRQDTPELMPFYKHFSTVPLVSISDSQRSPQPQAHWLGTVYHGLPADLYEFSANADDYFVFIGRISPEKRVDRAIDIAVRCGKPILVAAKIDKLHEDYFRQQIEPLLSHPLVHYLGEVGGEEKRRLLQRAKALLFPIDWPEPFGLVMIEAMACGTPVIAYGEGAVPEIVEHGITGFVVTDQTQAVWAATRVDELDRMQCRARFEERFTARRMTENYLRIYHKLVSRPLDSTFQRVRGERHG